MAVSFDMFSLLPDPLLFIIVSLLPFKEAVRTSVLSKRWLRICKATTNLEFNELFFVESGQPDQTREAQRRVFLNFVTFYIDNYREPVVDKFFLKLSMPENVGEVIERCIAFATQRGVKELGLDFSDPNWEEDNFDEHEALVELPRHVYGHKTLESLKLFSCSFVETNLLNFHALKEVSFGWMELTNSAISTLLKNCKALESMSLKKCWNLSPFELGEKKLSLRKLVVDKCHFHFDLFKINAPNLRFFKYSGPMNFFYVEVSKSMEEADLDFSLEFEFDGHGPFLYNLVEDLCPVKVLTVCSYLLQVLPNEEEPLRMHCDLNVTHLTMKTALHPNEFLGITFLLNSCPMLECLTIELGFGRFLPDYEPVLEVEHKRFWMDNVKVYKCLRSTLKVVQVKGFRGTINELLVLNYFIQCGKVLKKISINILKEKNAGDSRSEEFYRKVAELLLTIQRASADLEISIC